MSDNSETHIATSPHRHSGRTDIAPAQPARLSLAAYDRVCYTQMRFSVSGNEGVTTMKATFFSEFMSAAKEAPRLYFAPLVGAGRAIKDEFRRVEEGAAGKAPQAPTAKH